jgi:hypothetical protein
MTKLLNKRIISHSMPGFPLFLEHRDFQWGYISGVYRSKFIRRREWELGMFY